MGGVNALLFQSASGIYSNHRAFSRPASSIYLKELYDHSGSASRYLKEFYCCRSASRALSHSRIVYKTRILGGIMALDIPEGLSRAESGVYQKLLDIAAGLKPRPIVVITDIGKDYDDLAALVILKEFHRLKFVELRAVVANLMPANRRARLARTALDSLDLSDIPVACGTRGSPHEHEVLDHELNDIGLPPADAPDLLQDGQDLLLKVYENAKEKGEKLHLLCLSSLRDIHDFASTHPDLVAECTSEVHMQGGNYFSADSNLMPDEKAANNRFDMDAAMGWHSFIQARALPSYTYTKVAAFAAPLTADVFKELEGTGHPIGAYLRKVQVEQDLAFYKQACESDPAKRFAPFMDQKWFLTNKTNWNEARTSARPERAHDAEGGEDALPTAEEVIPYLTKIVVYDAQAALGVAGEKVVSELEVFLSCPEPRSSVVKRSEGEFVKVPHRIIGEECRVVPERMSLAMSALLKGSLIKALS